MTKTAEFDVSLAAATSNFRNKLMEDIGITVKQVGEVSQFKDGVAVISNFNAGVDEAVRFQKSKMLGLVMSLEEDGSAGVIVLGNSTEVKPGDVVERTGEQLHIPVGEVLMGRVIDPLGNPIDGKGALGHANTRVIEKVAPGVIERAHVNCPVQTGIKVIDGLIPIGRGQRELIIGDRGTGKTSLAIDTIINQKGKNLTCIYVAIGKKTSELASIAKLLEREGALEHTIIVSATASSSAPIQYIAPFVGCAIGEEIMENGGDGLVVYDDLTKHAQAYREISLLLRRPSGREAYPGDIFYLHSRLLERSAKLSPDKKGGSLTALPIIETLEGDVSAYIPTNVISITDGQIYLQTDLFNAGVRPAVDVGLSVSRVGGAAQKNALRRAVGPTKMAISQYFELAKFATFSGDLDRATKEQLIRGEKIVEMLKQSEHRRFSLADQVALFYAVNNGGLDKIPTGEVGLWQDGFLGHLEVMYPSVRRGIESTGELNEEVKTGLDEALKSFVFRNVVIG